MKVVMIQYEDTVDISQLAVGSTVQVGTIQGGKIVFNGNFINPSLTSHKHTVNVSTETGGPTV